MEHPPHYVLYGCGGHSRSIADVLLHNNTRNRITFVDAGAREGERILDFEVVQAIFLTESDKCIVAIGNNYLRKKKLDELNADLIVSVISRRAYVSGSCKIGKGCFVAHGSHVGPEALIGANTILNTCSVVEHEVVVGMHTHIGPNATICGRSEIGDFVVVGVGATVIDKIRICSHAIIGAGATVVGDIRSPGIYVGTPATKIDEMKCEA